MNVLKKVLGRIGHAMKGIWNFATSDDLQEAQKHRGDYHEFRSNPGGPGAG